MLKLKVEVVGELASLHSKVTQVVETEDLVKPEEVHTKVGQLLESFRYQGFLINKGMIKVVQKSLNTDIINSRYSRVAEVKDLKSKVSVKVYAKKSVNDR